jgi:hypothetical protein
MQMVILAEARPLLSAATAPLVSVNYTLTECHLCQETYCSMCLLFHMDEPHAKPNALRRSASSFT